MSTKHSSLYRQIISQAWKISWHHKMMWVFGIFSAFIATGGALEIFSRNVQMIFTPHLPFFWRAEMHFVGGWSKIPLLIMLFLLCLGLAVFFVLMIVRSFATLILATDKYEGKKMDLGKIWQQTNKNFWLVFWPLLVLKIIVGLAILLSIFPLWLIWSGYNSNIWPWIYPILFILGVVITIIASLLMVLAGAYATIKKYPLLKSLKMAWFLFIKNWLTSLEMAVVIFLLNFLFGILTIFGLFIIAIPTFLFVFFGLLILFPVLTNVAFFLGTLFSILLILWLAGFLGTFHTVAWTLLFKRMEEGTATAKLHRLANQL